MFDRVEWPTLALIVACSIGLMLTTSVVAGFSVPLAVVLAGVLIALHSSLSHEVLHGHPFANRALSEALVWVQPNLAVPYVRFRDTHLAHHMDANLTDPYEDPESQYLDAAVWAKLPGWGRWVLRVNNTMAGRILIGTLIGQWAFMKSDWALIRDGDKAVLNAWLWHIPGVILVLGWVTWMGAMPVWAYLLACYIGLSLIRIRTFLEHQAHDRCSARTAIVEGGGVLSFLFLNNNLHVVHHMHPKVPWYRLPKLYRDNRARYLTRNGGYHFDSYGAVCRQYFWRRKEPVVHPLWRGK